jgi:hypothetical protein
VNCGTARKSRDKDAKKHAKIVSLCTLVVITYLPTDYNRVENCSRLWRHAFSYTYRKRNEKTWEYGFLLWCLCFMPSSFPNLVVSSMLVCFVKKICTKLIHTIAYPYRDFLENSEAGVGRSLLCKVILCIWKKELTVRSETQSSLRVVFCFL